MSLDRDQPGFDFDADVPNAFSSTSVGKGLRNWEPK